MPDRTYACIARAVCATVIAAAAWNCGDGIGIPIQAEAPAVTSRTDAGARVRDGGHAGAGAIDAGKHVNADAGARVDAGNDIRDVPDTAYCMPVARWAQDDASSERELLAGINQVRASASVGGCGSRAPCRLQSLQMLPELRCSARRHSFDMAHGSAFDKIDSNGKGPHDRMLAAGLTPRVWGESIAQDSSAQGSNLTNILQQIAQTPQTPNSGPELPALLDSQYTRVGIGHYAQFWTIDFADP
jgi:uncharacterized protein YkwD